MELEELKTHVQDANIFFLSEEGNLSVDMVQKNWFKKAQEAQKRQLKETGFVYVENDWYEDDKKNTIRKKFGVDDLEDDYKNDNSYNSSYFLPDFNWRLFKTPNNKTLLEIRLHLGGDVRGNYSGGWYKVFNDSEDAIDFIYIYLFGNTYAEINFDDGSDIFFDGEGSDVFDFGVSKVSEEHGLAEEAKKEFESLLREDKDGFVLQLVEASGKPLPF